MNNGQIRVSSEPCDLARLPFDSESRLQRFVKEHADDLLGIQIVGVAERNGGMISRIDLFGVDRFGKPWIVECKHDLVDTRAISQLRRYHAAVLARWPDIEKIIAVKCGSIKLQEHPQPGLVTIGYRYDQSVAAVEGITCLAYQYHEIEFTDDKLQKPRPGRVSLHRIEDILLPTERHPRVLKKKDETLKRLAALDSSLAAAFRNIDRELNRLPGVEATYGGKNFVRYRCAATVFATAVIGADAVEWRLKEDQVVTLRTAADVSKTLSALRGAYQQAG